MISSGFKEIKMAMLSRAPPRVGAGPGVPRGRADRRLGDPRSPAGLRAPRRGGTAAAVCEATQPRVGPPGRPASAYNYSDGIIFFETNCP